MHGSPNRKILHTFEQWPTWGNNVGGQLLGIQETARFHFVEPCRHLVAGLGGSPVEIMTQRIGDALSGKAREGQSENGAAILFMAKHLPSASYSETPWPLLAR